MASAVYQGPSAGERARDMGRWFVGAGVLAAILVVGLQLLSTLSTEPVDAHLGLVRLDSTENGAERIALTRVSVGPSAADTRWADMLLADAFRTQTRISPSAAAHAYTHHFTTPSIGRNPNDHDDVATVVAIVADIVGDIVGQTVSDASADAAKLLHTAASWQERLAARTERVAAKIETDTPLPVRDAQIATPDPSELQQIANAPTADSGEPTTVAASSPSPLPIPAPEPVSPPATVAVEPPPDDPAPQPEASDPLLAGAMVEAALMVSLVNQARGEAGLPTLVVDFAMAAVARSHSIDMATNDYFAHTNLAGLSPFDRMRNAGIAYQGAGENIARYGSTAAAHAGLMDSPGHRANILNERFARIGIGVFIDGTGSMFFTQLFAY